MFNRRIILDASPSVDNYFGILYAIKNFEVKALILNDSKDYHEILCKNLSFINKTCDLPKETIWGKQEPIIKVKNNWDSYNNILFEEDLKYEEVKVSKDKPWDILYNTAKQENGITIVTLSSLTNIAITLFKYEDLINYVDEIIIMGGTTDIGNIGPYSEANFTKDPYSAEVVMNSGIPITAIGLNVFRKSNIELEDFNTYNDNPHYKEILELIKSNKEVYCYGEDIVFPDILTLAYVKQREILKTNKYYSTVEYKGDLCLGRQNIDIRKHCEEEPNCNIAIDINRDLYLKELKDFLNQKNPC